jgi:hypothetical protein
LQNDCSCYTGSLRKQYNLNHAELRAALSALQTHSLCCASQNITKQLLLCMPLHLGSAVLALPCQPHKLAVAAALHKT